MLPNKIGVGTSTYMNLPLGEALEGISKAGFSYVEVAAIKGILEHIQPGKMGTFELQLFEEELQNSNLKLVAIAAYSDLTKEENVPYMKTCIDLAGKLGAQFVTTGVNNQGNDSSQSAIKQFYAHIKELGEYAVEKGIIIGLETHGGIVATGRQAAKVVQRINSQAIKISYDTGNVIFHGGVRPEEDLKYALEYLGYVHLKDKIGDRGIWNFPPLGEGTIDFELLFDMLAKEKYSGPFTAEIEFDEDTRFQKGTRRTVEMVNQAVKKSHNFLTGRIGSLAD